jgi:hypothetical protein
MGLARVCRDPVGLARFRTFMKCLTPCPRAASSGGSFFVGLSQFPSLVQAASGARLNSAAVAGVARQTAAAIRSHERHS